jgi:hypothetical protein
MLLVVTMIHRATQLVERTLLLVLAIVIIPVVASGQLELGLIALAQKEEAAGVVLLASKAGKSDATLVPLLVMRMSGSCLALDGSGQWISASARTCQVVAGRHPRGRSARRLGPAVVVEKVLKIA